MHAGTMFRLLLTGVVSPGQQHQAVGCRCMQHTRAPTSSGPGFSHLPAMRTQLQTPLRTNLHTKVRVAPPVCFLPTRTCVIKPRAIARCPRNCIATPPGTSAGIPGIAIANIGIAHTEYDKVAEYMQFMSPQHNDAVASTLRMIAYMIRAHPSIRRRIGFVSVTSRTKSVYSTWMKMKLLGCPVHEIRDLVAVRIVLSCVTDRSAADNLHVVTEYTHAHRRLVAHNEHEESYHTPEDTALCYNVLDLVHSSYAPLVTKDFIMHPKPNGYRSLHTTVMVGVQPVEIQIRTVAMHTVAENGTAAHFAYKEKQYDC